MQYIADAPFDLIKGEATATMMYTTPAHRRSRANEQYEFNISIICTGSETIVATNAITRRSTNKGEQISHRNEYG